MDDEVAQDGAAKNPANDAADDDGSSWSEWLVHTSDEEVVLEYDEHPTPLLSPDDGYSVTGKQEDSVEVKQERLDELDDNAVKQVLAESGCKAIGEGLLQLKKELTQVV